MFVKRFSGAIVILGLIFFMMITSAGNVKAQSHPPNAMWVDPSAISLNQYTGSVGTRFNVTVWINVNNGSQTWQVFLEFNASLLQATNAGYTGEGGVHSEFYENHSGIIPVTPVIDNVTGTVWMGESLLGGDYAGPGTGSLMWTEFQVASVPDVHNTLLTCQLDVNNNDTFVNDWDGFEMTNSSTKFDATYSSQYISDTTPPTIGNPTQVPLSSNVGDGQSVTVSVNVTDEVGGSGVANVTLFYSTDNSTFSNATMTLNSTTGLWDGTIPGYTAGTTVYYKIIAYDNAGNSAVNSNVGNWSYVVLPEFGSPVLMIVMLAAVTSAVLLMRKKIIR